MSLLQQVRERVARRLRRMRSRVRGTAERPRLVVNRSLKHISAQIIDDATGRTLAAAADRDLGKATGTKTEVSKQVGALLATRAKEKGVTAVVFDRRDKKYHGRIAALAEGAREGGLAF